MSRRECRPTGILQSLVFPYMSMMPVERSKDFESSVRLRFCFEIEVVESNQSDSDLLTFLGAGGPMYSYQSFGLLESCKHSGAWIRFKKTIHFDTKTFRTCVVRIII